MDPSVLSGVGALDFGLFAAGCIAGWGFAQRTAVKLANDRITEIKADCERERKASDAQIAILKERTQLLEDQRYRDAREDAGKTDMDAKFARIIAEGRSKPDG